MAWWWCRHCIATAISRCCIAIAIAIAIAVAVAIAIAFAITITVTTAIAIAIAICHDCIFSAFCQSFFVCAVVFPFCHHRICHCDCHHHLYHCCSYCFCCAAVVPQKCVSLTVRTAKKQ